MNETEYRAALTGIPLEDSNSPQNTQVLLKDKIEHLKA